MNISATRLASPLVLCGFVLASGCAAEAEPTDDVEQPALSVEPDPCEQLGEVETCATASGAEGARTCEYDATGEQQLVYGECAAVGSCRPGDTTSCNLPDPIFAGLTRGCILGDDGTWQWDPFACNTPLVLSFDSAPVEFTRASGTFDLAGLGASFGHDWVSPKTPWLVLDKNGNGSIDDGRELFGSMTELAAGGRAANGFQALAELDTNRDGRIDAADPAYRELFLWRDDNQDRASNPAELDPLSESGVTMLSLDYQIDRRCTATACEVERAAFEFFDARGRAHQGVTIDVHFRLY